MKKFLLQIFAVSLLLIPKSGSAALPFDLTKLSGGSESAPTEVKKLPEEEDVRKLRDAVIAEQTETERLLEIPHQISGDAESQFYQSRLQGLEQLGIVYNELLETFDVLGKVKARVSDISSQLELWRAGTPPKNFVADFSTLDKLRGQIVEAQKNVKARNQIYESRLNSLQEAKDQLEAAESKRRQVKENAGAASSPEEKAEKTWILGLTQLKSRTAEAQVQLRELELQVSKKYREMADKQKELSALQTAYLEKNVVFDQAALDRELSSLEAEKQGLEEKLRDSHSALANSGREYTKARQRLDQSPQPTPLLVEEVEARRLEQSFWDQQTELLTERLRRLKDRENLWKQRFLLLGGKIESSQMGALQDQTQQGIEQIGRDEDLVNLRLNSVRNALAENRVKLSSNANADPQTRKWMELQRDYIQKNLELLQDHQAALSVTKKFKEKFLFEQEQRSSNVDWKQRLQKVWEGFKRFWAFEITSVDDSPITVGKVVVALILVLFGGMLAGRLSRWLAEGILPRFGIGSGVAAALKTLTYYLLFLFFFILALNIVRVPLTLFAVLGGAVAIGVGFGSQALMNNFISGIILLIQRPIKVGDIVQIDSTIGTVEQIGGRSTQIRTPDNTHYIVPNASFLEKPVMNWTLSDDLIRLNIRLGVAYGSPTRKVSDLMKKAALEHGKILKSPPPQVWFSDFGNDSLVFDLLFWSRVRTIGEKREIESDMRFMIDSLFREAEIVIAFPQRDVHFHPAAPLELKISRASPKKELQD